VGAATPGAGGRQHFLQRDGLWSTLSRSHPPEDLIRALTKWAGALHWGQLLMVLFGFGTLAATAALTGALVLSPALSARASIAAGDFCCDERLRTDGIAYRVSARRSNSVALAGGTDSARALLLEYLTDSSKAALRQVGRAKAKRAGYTDAEIDAHLGVERDTRQTRAELEADAGLASLVLGYGCALLSIAAALSAVLTLWHWFGARGELIARN
jgi:hypothetical protein